MAEKSELVLLEKEQIKLEHFKVYGNIVTVLITVALGTFGVALINNSFQQRQLEQQRLINAAQLELQQKQAEADWRQAEMKYLGEYLENALQDDVSRRLRFAEYFAILTLSPDLQERWKAYQADMEAAIVQQQQLKADLSKATETQDRAKQTDLENQLALIELKLAQLDKSGRDDTLLPQSQNYIGFNQTPNVARLQLRMDLDFLNRTLPALLKPELEEDRRQDLEALMPRLKLALLYMHWERAWGNFQALQQWVTDGEPASWPEGVKPEVFTEYYYQGKEQTP